MEKETHPFSHYIPPKATKLIIGSFPCINTQGSYGEWFYCGSGKNLFWQLLSEVFEMPINSLDEKKALCQKAEIALTDIAYQIRRKKNNCSDANLQILEYNTKAIEKCLIADIDIQSIYFTSLFVKKHFEKAFKGISLPSFVLPSPSPSANIYIGGLEEYKQLKEKQIVESTYDYRLIKYRELL